MNESSKPYSEINPTTIPAEDSREHLWAEYQKEEERIMSEKMAIYEEQLIQFEEGIPFEMVPGEFPEEYLYRISVFAETDRYKLNSYTPGERGLNLLQDVRYSGYFKTCLDYLMVQLDVRDLDKKTNPRLDVAIEVFERLGINTQSTVWIDESQSFSHTKENRSFFGTSNGDHIPYAQSLFCLSGDEKTDYEYVKDRLEGKDICMLGGGDSVQDLMSSNIKPKSFVNIDPYLKSERVDKAQETPYVSIPIDSTDSDAIDVALKQLGNEEFDEIWASYSVPMYLCQAAEVKGLFTTIKGHLKEGGTARITPLRLRPNWREDAPWRERAAFKEVIFQVEELIDSSDFNIYFIRGNKEDTLIIRKLAKSKNTTQ